MPYNFKKAFLAIALALSAGGAVAAPQTVKFGVLTDMSSIMSGWSGRGSQLAAEMAAEDFRKMPGNETVSVSVLGADHQNKPDLASVIARQWIDIEGVNAILDVPNSAAALAVNAIVKSSKAAVLFSGPAHDALTGAECTPNTVQWTFDTWSLANGTARTTVEQGGKNWFFVTADFAGGHALEKVVADVVTKSGGKVLGRTVPPIGTADFASYLLQAQQSKAQIVALSMSGSDFTNALKQAAEFGLVEGGQRMAGLVVMITDIHSLGLQATRGLLFTEAFYWDIDEGTRAFAKRFAARNNGLYPTQIQAGVYASALHYLKAAKEANSTDGKTVVEAMKRLPTDDQLFGKGSVRKDGRVLHDMFVFEVKSPNESKGLWDYYKLVRRIPAEEAFQPANPSLCALAK